MKVAIFTEGGRGIGFGHVIRCSALRASCAAAGFRTDFIIKGDTGISEYLKNVPHRIMDWQSPDRAGSLVSKDDIAIIDSYLAGPEVYGALAAAASHCVYIDDCNRMSYPAGTILNSNAYGGGVDYKRVPGREFLLGPKYVPMRREFWTVRFRPVRREVRKVLLIFGGTDFGGIMPFVLKFFSDRYPALEKRMIVGQGVPCRDRLEKIRDDNTELIYGAGARRVRDEMLACDCAFTAGGQTLYELARTGLPAAAICVADNQVDNIASMKKAGALCGTDITAKNISAVGLEAALAELAPEKTRKSMRRAGRMLVDGRGAERVAAYIARLAGIQPRRNSRGKTVKIKTGVQKIADR